MTSSFQVVRNGEFLWNFADSAVGHGELFAVFRRRLQLNRVMNNSGSGGIGASGGRRTLGPRRPAGRLGAAGAKPSARRCLFGPVDHQETDDFLKEMNRQLDEQKKELWGFDFKAGRPVPGGHPVYEWVRVGANDDIPCAYGRLGESWRSPEIVSWSNEYTEIQGVEGADVSLNSYRLNEHSRKRLRRLSPDNPELDTALTSYCSSAGDCQNRGLDKAVTKHSSDCSNAGGSPVELEGVSRPGDELPLKDLRKSEKLEKHSGSKPSDVPGCLEGSGLPSTVRAKDVDVPEDFPTMMNDDSIVALPNPRYDSVPENK